MRFWWRAMVRGDRVQSHTGSPKSQQGHACVSKSEIIRYVHSGANNYAHARPHAATLPILCRRYLAISERGQL
jgi:hypothetical protein